MKDILKFLKSSISIALIVLLIIGAGFFSKIDRINITYGLKYKHELLKKIAGPRIVFVGGSNLRFGLISQLIKDSLVVNPINTSVFADFGLKFIIEDLKPYLKKGDIIVLAPEYNQFYGSAIWGAEQMAQGINICPEDIKLLNIKQLVVLIKTLPRNNLGKLKASAQQLIFGKNPPIKSYERYDGMNQYGDTFAHWTLPNEPYVPDIIVGKFNSDAIKLITNFNNYVTGTLNGKLLITYPPYPQHDFNTNQAAINQVQNELEKQNLTLLGSPRNYIFPDYMFFNSSYHLDKEGAMIRTNKLILDIKKAID